MSENFSFPSFADFSERKDSINKEQFKKTLKSTGYFPQKDADTYLDMAYFIADQDGKFGITPNEYEL